MKIKRDHLVIYDNATSYTFWIASNRGDFSRSEADDIRGTETKERFEDVHALIDYLKTCHQTIETFEVI